MTLPTYIIVGAGQTGAHAAMALREAGFAGRILLLGDEAAAPYERPPLSKEALQKDPPPAPSWFFTPARYAERGIELRLGTHVIALDPAGHRITLQNGEALQYDRLLLATGGSARRLVVPGHDRVLYLRTLDDAAHLRARLVAGAHVVCIGAGVIGLEIAASARARGCVVTVVEAGPRAMGRSLTEEWAGIVAALHDAHGVDMRFGVSVAEVTAQAVICTDARAVPADVVVAGVGMTPNVGLAQMAGLALRDGGIEVDAFGRSSAAAVFAAGDVATAWNSRHQRFLRQETWRHAMNHGIATGRAMAGLQEPYDDTPWFWSDQYDINLQQAGLPDTATHTVWRGQPGTPGSVAFHLNKDGVLVAATGANAPREIRAAMALIRAGAKPDPARLADPAVTAQHLARG